MEEHTRRAVVLGAASLTTALAGCSATSGDDGTPRQPSETPTPTETPTRYDIQTPRPGDCRELSVPRPTPTDEGLGPYPYPSRRDQLTPGAAVGYATQFEKAYQYNEFLVRFGDMNYDEVFVTGGVPDWAVMERGSGYIVGVNVQVKFHIDDTPTGTKTPGPSGTYPTSAWYYLTDRFALRNEVEAADLVEGRDEPTFDDPAAVVCTD